MQRVAFVLGVGLIPLILSGCAAPTGSAELSVPVAGSVSMIPKSEISQREDGEVCVGSLESGRTLDGSQVVLRDATGSVVGISILEGYSGELPEESQMLLGQGIYRSSDGLCHWEFSIDNVESDTKFFEVEVAGLEGKGLVFRSEEALSEGINLFLGGESIEQETERLEREAELTRQITCAINPDSYLCDD